MAIEVSPIFSDTIKHLKYGSRRIIHQGGQSSGKTVNILIALATMSAEESYGVTTVTGMSFPHLKGGALRDFEMYVYPEFKGVIKQYHKTDHLFLFQSGSIIEFKAFETEMDARGAKRRRLFVNEANKFDYLKFFQLDSRSEQTVMDYNPSIRFWAHEKHIGEPGNTLLLSDHRHNPFLTEEKHREIENICIFDYNADGTIKLSNGVPVVLKGDYELWKVYARGLTGNVTGIIFPNWEKIDDSVFDDDNDCFYGIDFGYTNDPTALMKMYRIGDTLFVKELAYETGLPAKSIRNILLANGFRETDVIYCEHDADMIRQLRNIGITNAMPARKVQGSINAGIELLKKYNVKYTCSSRNLDKEIKMYVWTTDKVTGEVTNIPVDNNNHTFDAIRYGAYSRFLPTGN
jgi:phage terminase large subunit